MPNQNILICFYGYFLICAGSDEENIEAIYFNIKINYSSKYNSSKQESIALP